MKNKPLYWICTIWMAGALFASADMHAFTGLNLTIPDDDSNGIGDTQTVSAESGTISSIEVQLNIGSALGDVAFNGDLYLQLQHGTGFSVLLNRVGVDTSNAFGYSEEGFDITFTVGGSDIHTYGEGAFGINGNNQLTGTWGVDGRAVDPQNVLFSDPQTAMLDSFVGLDPNGDWTLFALDETTTGVAQINSWGLDIQTVPEPVTAGLLAISGLVIAAYRRIRKTYGFK